MVWTLFLAGLFVQFLAFLVSQSDGISSVRAMIGRDILWMEPLLIKLHDAKKIDTEEKHFRKLERLIIRDLSSKNSRFRMRGYEDDGDVGNGIESLTPHFISENDPAAYMNFPLNKMTVRADLVSGGRVMLNMGALDDYFQERMKFDLLAWAALVFCCGTLFELAGFIVDEHGK